MAKEETKHRKPATKEHRDPLQIWYNGAACTRHIIETPQHISTRLELMSLSLLFLCVSKLEYADHVIDRNIQMCKKTQMPENAAKILTDFKKPPKYGGFASW